MAHETTTSSSYDLNSQQGSEQSEATGKGIIYQIGIGLLSIAGLFIVVGFIVRTALTVFK